MLFRCVCCKGREKCATAGQQRLGHEMSLSLRSIIEPYFLRRTKADVGMEEASQAARGSSSAPL